jgi:hypothetical protein
MPPGIDLCLSICRAVQTYVLSSLISKTWPAGR